MIEILEDSIDRIKPRPKLEITTLAGGGSAM